MQPAGFGAARFVDEGPYQIQRRHHSAPADSVPVAGPGRASGIFPAEMMRRTSPSMQDLLSPPDSHLQAHDYVRRVSQEHEMYLQKLSEVLQLLGPQRIISATQIRQLEEVGQGAFAVVRRGIFFPSLRSAVEVVVKHFRRSTPDKLMEMIMMKDLDHPNIVPFLGVVVAGQDVSLVLQFAAGGPLAQLVSDRSWPIDVHRMLVEIAGGMAYLHSQSIVHRDLNTKNIFLDVNHTCRIGDFGLSRYLPGRGISPSVFRGRNDAAFVARRTSVQFVGGTLQPVEMMSGEVGTPQYMAPEVIAGETYTEMCDVYSFGIIAWELFTRCPPWQGVQVSQVFQSVQQGMRPPLPPMPQSLATLIQNCWAQDPAKRPPFSHILSFLHERHGFPS